MKKVRCVCFPRSGHHLLVNYLARYFGGDLHFDSRSVETGCDMSHFSTGKFTYCEYYEHCVNVPCIDPRTNFQKNHDFNMQLENEHGSRYIVQYRDPLAAIVSRFRRDAHVFKSVKYSRESWNEYFRREVSYWNAFYDKWIRKNKNPLTYFLRYEDFINDPEAKVREAIKFCAPDTDIKEDWLKEVINSIKIYPNTTVSSFEYLNKLPAAFSSQETMT